MGGSSSRSHPCNLMGLACVPYGVTDPACFWIRSELTSYYRPDSDPVRNHENLKSTTKIVTFLRNFVFTAIFV
jgi:hypothetical protein